MDKQYTDPTRTSYTYLNGYGNVILSLHGEKLIWLVLTMLFMVMKTSFYTSFDDLIIFIMTAEGYFNGIKFQSMCK